jgi:hypothetical protein
MIILAVVIFIFVLAGIISAVEEIGSEGAGIGTVIFSIVVAFFLSSICYFGFYESTRIDVEKLYAEQQNILLNYKTLVLNMNKVAVVKENTNNILIDAANLKQSTNTSQAFAIWVETANQYNLNLAAEKGKREMGFFGKLWYCWRVPLRNDIKYIEVKLN